ncbi:DUF397 domain-containing protein [Streptomyces sp. McG3]|uniref:DUF397 domain-containing protein n=1 Tax=Streptomyces sp. McG3 TaxID=2725483 RepID=UPI0035A8D4E6
MLFRWARTLRRTGPPVCPALTARRVRRTRSFPPCAARRPVRDSTRLGGPVLTLAPAAWDAFRAGLRRRRP